MALWLGLAVFCIVETTDGKVYNLGNDVDKGPSGNLPPAVDNWEFLTYNNKDYYFLSTKEMPFVEGNKECKGLTKYFESTDVYRDLEFEVLSPSYDAEYQVIVKLLNKLGLEKDIWQYGSGEDDEGNPLACRVYRYHTDKKQFSVPQTDEESVVEVPCNSKLLMLCGGRSYK